MSLAARCDACVQTNILMPCLNAARHSLRQRRYWTCGTEKDRRKECIHFLATGLPKQSITRQAHLLRTRQPRRTCKEGTDRDRDGDAFLDQLAATAAAAATARLEQEQIPSSSIVLVETARN